MPPSRVMFIRHAEKPEAPWGDGITDQGKKDPESLTVRGWQRAGALARFFAPLGADPHGIRPDVVFASMIAKHSESERPDETVTPLVDLIDVPFVTTHTKDDLDGLVKAIMGRSGRVLVSWQHEDIPTIIGKMPKPPPGVPKKWPGARFDIVWILDAVTAEDTSWAFSQLPQMLLAGDSDQPIPDIPAANA